MKHLILLAAVFMAAGANAMPADPPAKDDVVAFSASVRVDVDAAGKLVKVEVPQDLPEAIRSAIEQRVASWQYQPTKIEGVPQAATTYVAVNACAIPVAGGYRLGVDFDGNGVRTAGDRRLMPPEYPSIAQRSGAEAEFVLLLGIEKDGRVVIDEIEKADVSGRVGEKDFTLMLRKWVKTLRFDPEIVAGHPIRGQARMPVSFVMGDHGNRRTLKKEEWQANAKASRECQLASGNSELSPVALRPAVTIIPTPAG
jgi:hypothetical protein